MPSVPVGDAGQVDGRPHLVADAQVELALVRLGEGVRLPELHRRHSGRADRPAPHSSASTSTGHRRDDGVRPVQQAGLEGERRLVVQPLRLPLRDELGDDDGDHVVGALGVELVEVLEHRLGQLAVRRGDRVQRDRHVVVAPTPRRAAPAPRASVTTETAISRSGASDRAYCTASSTPRWTEPTSTTTRWVRRGGRVARRRR